MKLFWCIAVACVVGPVLTGLVAGCAFRSPARGICLAVNSLLGLLGGVGMWLMVGGFIMGGGPPSLVFGPIALVCGWAVGIAVPIVAFRLVDRTRRSDSTEDSP